MFSQLYDFSMVGTSYGTNTRVILSFYVVIICDMLHHNYLLVVVVKTGVLLWFKNSDISLASLVMFASTLISHKK